MGSVLASADSTLAIACPSLAATAFAAFLPSSRLAAASRTAIASAFRPCQVRLSKSTVVACPWRLVATYAFLRRTLADRRIISCTSCLLMCRA